MQNKAGSKGIAEPTKIKYQTESITFNAGQPIGIQGIRRQLDNGMDRVTGVYVAVIQGAGGGVNWRLGIKDDDFVYQAPTHFEEWVTSTAVPHRERYKPIDIAARGNTAEIQFQFLNNTTQQLIVDVVFKLERVG